MPVNYFMLSKDGVDLMGPHSLVPGTAGGVGFADTFASSLSPWFANSYDIFNSGAGNAYPPSVVSGRARLNMPAYAQGVAYLSRQMWEGWDDISVTAEVAPTAVPGSNQVVSLQARWFSTSLTCVATVSVSGGRLITDISGASQNDKDNGVYDPVAHRWWRIAEKDGQIKFSVSPNGSTWTVVDTRTHGWPPPNGVDAGDLYFRADTVAGPSPSALEVFLDNVSAQVGNGLISGLLPTLASASCSPLHLYMDANGDGLYEPNAPSWNRHLPLPSGFAHAAFMAWRDPAFSGDDSADAAAVQAYRHGGTLSHLLVEMLASLGTLAWPLPTNYKLLPVTGTPAVSRPEGLYGLTSMSIGSAIPLRALLGGNEDATHKVAAILDLLKATTAAQRTTIASTFTSTRDAIGTAWTTNLNAVSGPASSEAGRQFNLRVGAAARLAEVVVGGGTAGTAAQAAMFAIVAKEAGLIGSTFTTANYETMTQPIDAVLAMPSGY